MCKGEDLIYDADYPFSCWMKPRETTKHLEDSRLWGQNLKPITYEHKTSLLISAWFCHPNHRWRTWIMDLFTV